MQRIKIPDFFASLAQACRFSVTRGNANNRILAKKVIKLGNLKHNSGNNFPFDIMPTKLPTPTDEMQNWLLDQALANLPAWLSARFPWDQAVKMERPNYKERLRSEREKATQGASKAPTAVLKKQMSKHAKFLEQIEEKVFQQPPAWATELSRYEVGELFFKHVDGRVAPKDSPSILGQADLTIWALIPTLSRISAPGEVQVPAPPCSDLWDHDELNSQWVSDPENGRYAVSGTGTPPEITLNKTLWVLRFVLAPSPTNRIKALKQMQQIRAWADPQDAVYFRGSNSPYDLDFGFGIISDDKRLCEIVIGQGAEAIYIPKTLN